MLAATQERFDWLKGLHAKGRYLDMETEVISPCVAAEIMPLLDRSHFVGAVYVPIERHLDPSGTTWAYVKAAQKQVGKIYLQTRVEMLEQVVDRSWSVHTNRGRISYRTYSQCRRTLGQKSREDGGTRTSCSSDGASVPTY